MKIFFINPPNHQNDIDDLAPPLGLMMLAQAVMDSGFEASIIDLNLQSCRNNLPNVDFYAVITSQILESGADVVCFTSMGINSHVCLELALSLKRTNPCVITVFGGPHFASIAVQLKAAFPQVDYILSGAAENKIVQLLLELKRGERPAWNLPNCVSNASVLKLAHPWRAYSTISINDYFSTNPRRLLNFETGRGCKYSCRFCYSPSHWHGSNDFLLNDILEDFNQATSIGAQHLFLVQDNFLNDRKFASTVCLHLAELKSKPSWNCYATLRDINEEITVYLARAGCDAVYIGIDGVTSFQKKQFGKSAFGSEKDCIRKIEILISHNIVPTCAFILDPLNWSSQEVESTLRLALALRLSLAEISFHHLTTYSGTKLGRELKTKSSATPDGFRIRLMFDCPSIVVENSLVEKHPNLFPFHTRDSEDILGYRHSVALVHLAQVLLTDYPIEISEMIRNDRIDIVELVHKVCAGVALDMSNYWDPSTTKMAGKAVFEELICKSYGFEPVSQLMGR